MRYFKRAKIKMLLAFAMTVCLVLGTISVGAFAEEVSPAAGEDAAYTGEQDADTEDTGLDEESDSYEDAENADTSDDVLNSDIATDFEISDDSQSSDNSTGGYYRITIMR